MSLNRSNGYRNKHTKFHKLVYVNKNGKDSRNSSIKYEESWFEKLVHKFLSIF